MMNSEKIFSTILASTVHDMKNSLGVILDALNTLLSNLPKDQNNAEYGVVQYESSRVNSSLMQLLALYKIENNQLPYNPGYHNLYDFVEEQIFMHSPLLEAKNFQYELDIDEQLEAVFDDSLISMIITNVIGNAIRYAHSRILVTADVTDQTCLYIYDDGPGYPGPMLELAGNYLQGINQSSGSTGLGLFFAQTVAALHSHGGKIGAIELSNGGKLGGGVFKLTLP